MHSRNRICYLQKVKYILQWISITITTVHPYCERLHRYDCIFFINLSSIHCLCQYCQTFTFMRSLNANGFHGTESTETNGFFFWLLLSLCVQRVNTFKMFMQLHARNVCRFMIADATTKTKTFRGKKMKNKKKTLNWFDAIDAMRNKIFWNKHCSLLN